MAKNLIKLTESELEGLVKKIMLEENRTPSKKLKSSKSLNEGKQFLKKFHNKKKSLVREGYSKKEINEQLNDFLNFNDDTTMGDIALSSGKQFMVSWILSQLNVSGELNRILSIALSKADPSDYHKLFDPVDNCEFVSDLLFETFLDYLAFKLIGSVGSKLSGKSGMVGSTVGGVFGGSASADMFSMVSAQAVSRMLKNNDFKRNLQKMFEKALCDALSGRGGESELSTELDSSEVPDSLVTRIKQKL